MTEIIRNTNGQLKWPLRLIWNDTERRPRAPVRLPVGFILIFLFAGFGSGFSPEPLTSERPVVGAINDLVSVAPQTIGISAGVVLASLLLDRRVLTDLGLDLTRGWWRGLAGGTILGIGIAASGVVVGVLGGYIAISGIQVTGGILVWLVLVIAAAGFQLLYLIPEELFVRGYIITNIIEGLEGVPTVPREVAAGIGVVVASLVFYVTHSGRGTVFGLMAAGFAILLGIGYVLSGDLSIPVGIHFGINMTWVVVGVNPQSASLIELTATGTVAGSLILPIEVVIASLVAVVVGSGLMVWWERSMAGHVQIAPSIVYPTLRLQHDVPTTE